MPPAELTELVTRFRNNRDDYRGAYNEAQVRREFIDPLLELLGWDVTNRQGYAEAYKHVIHEDRVRIAGQSKAPDYSFRIGSTRKFFLEAKRPSINIIQDPESAYQLRRYAWSAKLSLSILTNFDFLAVYDCRHRPHINDKASTARVLMINFEDYGDKWDEISNIFSFSAINKGAFDRFAREQKASRGTAPVDDEFLNEIERWRDLLARAVLRRNCDLNSYELNDAVQKIIDRIVFLRIAEDRGIESEGRLRAIGSGSNIYGELCRYFKQSDARYNSGLFHFRAGDGNRETLDQLTLTLQIDNKPLQDIINHLYPPLSPYAFSYIPADILGQVYERFLGRVIRVRGRSIIVEDKPEVKKAGGVYYTPTFVVRYIVDHVIENLVGGRATAEVSGTGKGSVPIRVVDPACGSGSFLIEVYQSLLDWYLAQYTASDPERIARGKRPKIYRGPGNVWRLTIEERKRILTTHIFGVDIDPQAVEVTKLSLLLKVLEGETNDVLASQVDFLRNERVLPDLGANIRCGNSLIGEDFYGIFDASLLTEEQRHKVNVFDWKREFADVFCTGGFDAVVGNPPYGADLMQQEKLYLSRAFSEQSYQLDSYLLFVERALTNLLKDGGELGVIIPNPWLTNVLQTTTRKFIFTTAVVREIVHFTFPVFARAKATVDTEIVLLTKGRRKGHRPIARVVTGISPAGTIDPAAARTIEHEQDAWIAAANEPVNIFLDATQRALALKIRSAGQPLGLRFRISVGMKPYQVGKGKPKQTRSDVTNRIYDSHRKVSAQYRQYLRGSDITRFEVAPVEERYIRYGEWLAEPRPSAGFDAPEKIVVRQTGDSIVAAIDRNGFVCMNNMHVLTPNDPSINVHFASGLLNSKLMNWYYQALNPEMGEALAEVKKTNIERLPFPNASPDQQKTTAGLAELVESDLRALRAARDEASRRVARRVLDSRVQKLNETVYNLFGLNSAEIGLIEASQAGHAIG